MFKIISVCNGAVFECSPQDAIMYLDGTVVYAGFRQNDIPKPYYVSGTRNSLHFISQMDKQPDNILVDGGAVYVHKFFPDSGYSGSKTVVKRGYRSQKKGACSATIKIIDVSSGRAVEFVGDHIKYLLEKDVWVDNKPQIIEILKADCKKVFGIGGMLLKNVMLEAPVVPKKQKNVKPASLNPFHARF